MIKIIYATFLNPILYISPITIMKTYKTENKERLKEYKKQLIIRLQKKAQELRKISAANKKENNLDLPYNHALTTASKCHNKLYPIKEQEVNDLSNEFLIAFKNNDNSFFKPFEKEKIFWNINRLRRYIQSSTLSEEKTKYKSVYNSLISKIKVTNEEWLLSPDFLVFLGITLEDIKNNYREIMSLQLTVQFFLEQQWFKSIIIEHGKEGIPIHKNADVQRLELNINELENKKKDLQKVQNLSIATLRCNLEISKIEESLDPSNSDFFFEIGSVHYNYFSNVCYRLSKEYYNPFKIKSKIQLKLIIEKYVFLYNNIFEQEKVDYNKERNRINNRNKKPKSTEKYKKYQIIQELKSEGKKKAEICRKTGYARPTIDTYWEIDKDMESFLKNSTRDSS